MNLKYAGRLLGLTKGTLMDAEQAPEVSDLTCAEIELSIVVPCLNEAGTVGVCIDKAASYLHRGFAAKYW